MCANNNSNDKKLAEEGLAAIEHCSLDLISLMSFGLGPNLSSDN